MTFESDKGRTSAADNEMDEILFLMCKQTNKQFELKSVDPDSNKTLKNGIVVSLVPNGIKIKGFNYDFSEVPAMFNTIKDLIEGDEIKGDENKIKQFIRDIGYKQRGDTKSNRSKLIRRILVSFASPRRNCLREWRRSEG